MLIFKTWLIIKPIEPRQTGFLDQHSSLFGVYKINIRTNSHSRTTEKKTFIGKLICVPHLESSTKNDWFELNMKVKLKNRDQEQNLNMWWRRLTSLLWADACQKAWSKEPGSWLTHPKYLLPQYLCSLLWVGKQEELQTEWKEPIFYSITAQKKPQKQLGG